MWRHFDTRLNAGVAATVGFAFGPTVFDYTIGPLLLEYGGLGAFLEARGLVTHGVRALLAVLIFAGLQKFDQRAN